MNIKLSGESRINYKPQILPSVGETEYFHIPFLSLVQAHVYISLAYPKIYGTLS